MDDDLHVMAAANGGYLHRGDILEIGGSDALIRAMVRSHVLARIRVGTYAPTRTFQPLSPNERAAVLARSAHDKFDFGSVAISHHSAAAVRGMALHDVDLGLAHLTRLDGGAGRRESGIHHHRWVPGLDVVQLDDGRLAIDSAQATWQVACDAGRRGALVVMDSALHLGLVTPEQLQDAAGRYTAWRGARSARLVVPFADAGAETAGESLLRFVCFENDLPRPTTQYEVYDENGVLVARSDVGWHDLRHLGEFDGLRKYWRDLRPGEDASAVVVREKIREDAARRMLFGMSRTTYPEVLADGSRATGQRLRHDLDESHRLFARGRRHFA